MLPVDYLQTQFPRIEGATNFGRFGDDYKQRAETAVALFDKFMEGRFGNQAITMDHITCFMVYRVVGEEVVDGDRHSGAMALTTFQASELAALVNLLHHQGRVRFTAAEAKADLGYQSKCSAVKTLLGDSSIHTHARPLFLADEQVLRGSLTWDTASLRDEALIVLLRVTGARSASCTAVRHEMHCREGHGGSFVVTVPSVKTNYQMTHQVVLLGTDAAVFRRWLHRRRLLTQFHSPYLFITSTGKRCDTSDITQMLYKLGLCGGYGPQFFSSHSFRVGFANRVAARVYAEDGSRQMVQDRLAGALTWSGNSKAIHSYLDPNIQNFFRGGYGLSHDHLRS